ncbi:uncharacterized protein LOC111245537 [Varroa destructor]|uniref:Glycosyltransferase 61 catalytic domain-containing protein n=1 Tax=Varroa destructor TaxID=109461 RepID=A0A7M7JC53_VARDE|nr:uncharacterized protein LOC111245537 [Varroa destructor]XP_022649752.1 uncharacterized protein LOC111245537 [Varroa destructor]XP_022649753.1 uncharacterized protein LOC111245537 [Varroa destructor]XP_022649754.1 uncharacterized protein LOC111245537 [Varroa destructor]
MLTQLILTLILLNGMDPHFGETSSASCMYGPNGPRLNIDAADHQKRGEGIHLSDRQGHNIEHCIFRDVCWHRQGLLFKLKHPSDVRTEDSSSSWVYGSWPIKNLSASTADHNGLPIDVIPLSDEIFHQIVESSHRLVQLDQAILLQRYLPNNLMHVIHDDVLPAFALWEQLNNASIRSTYPHNGKEDNQKNQSSEVRLLLVDCARHEFDELYSLVGANVVYSEHGQITCVNELFVGLPRVTQWYQYGFKTPQGPLKGTDVNILERFRKRNGVPNADDTSRNNLDSLHGIGSALPRIRVCTLLIREFNRKILNIDQVEEKLRSELNCLVRIVSLSRYSLSELRKLISATDFLVAMHGAELALTIFLPRGSAVLEMFPYAVPSENYTPYRTLCSLLNIAYVAWENTIRKNSFGHMACALANLSDEEKARILKQDKVEPHLCCEDPAWLYRIYQDSWVDLRSFRRSLRILAERKWKMFQCNKPAVIRDLMSIVTFGKSSTFGSSTSPSSPGDWLSFWKHLAVIANGKHATFYLSRVRNPVCRRHEDLVSIRWVVPFNSAVATKTQHEFRTLHGKDQMPETNPSEGKFMSTKKSSASWAKTREKILRERAYPSVWYEVLTQCGPIPTVTGVILTRTQRTAVEIYCREKLLVWLKAERGTELPSPLIC